MVFAEAKRQMQAEGVWQEEENNPLQIRYYHCNQIGTPLALSDEQGQIVWAAQYDPWGNLQEEYNADPKNVRQDIRLPGQHHDRTTGLYYNRHRYYDPKLGAYINQDLIGLASGEPNLFNYVSDPIAWIDPLGLSVLLGGTGRSNSQKPSKQVPALLKPRPKPTQPDKQVPALLQPPKPNPDRVSAFRKEQNAIKEWMDEA